MRTREMWTLGINKLSFSVIIIVLWLLFKRRPLYFRNTFWNIHKWSNMMSEVSYKIMWRSRQGYKQHLLWVMEAEWWVTEFIILLFLISYYGKFQTYKKLKYEMTNIQLFFKSIGSPLHNQHTIMIAIDATIKQVNMMELGKVIIKFMWKRKYMKIIVFDKNQ